MELHPTLSAMRRNKVGAIVIVAQTAITLAILCNSLFLIQQRLRSSERPTGLQEQDIFTMANQWVGNPADLTAKTQADLAALRALPEVVDAFASNSYPLSNGGWDDGLSYEAGDPHWVTSGALYFADEHGLIDPGSQARRRTELRSRGSCRAQRLGGQPSGGADCQPGIGHETISEWRCVGQVDLPEHL